MEEKVNEVVKRVRRTTWGKYLGDPEKTFKEWLGYLSSSSNEVQQDDL